MGFIIISLRVAHTIVVELADAIHIWVARNRISPGSGIADTKRDCFWP